MTGAGSIADVFVALWVGHSIGDTWAQTDHDAHSKGGPGWTARLACARHVLTLTAVQLVALAAMTVATGLDTHPVAVAVGLLINAVSHYWIDRRTTLTWLVGHAPWLAGFYQLGRPRPGRDDDNPSLGTGAYALDQSWHHAWLFVAALIITAGAQ